MCALGTSPAGEAYLLFAEHQNYLIESYDLICRAVNKGGEVSGKLAFQGNEIKPGAVAQLVCPFLIKGAALCPHSLKIRIGFVGLVQSGKAAGDAEHNKQLVTQVSLQLWLGDIVQMEAAEAVPGGALMLTVFAHTYIVLNGLTLPTDGIAIKVNVHSVIFKFTIVSIVIHLNFEFYSFDVFNTAGK